MTGYIYFHVNKLNNKIYVGQTTLDPKQRWRSGYKGSTLIDNAIKKYGWDGFHHFVFKFENITMDRLNTIEQYWIKTLDTMNNGYNLTSGGYNSKPSKTLRDKWSKIKSKRVAQYNASGEIVGIYDSVKSAAIILGFSASSISKSCRGEIKSNYKSYVWKYIDPPREIVKKIKNGKRKSVSSYNNTGSIVSSFKSLTLAAEHFGVSKGFLRHKIVRNKEYKGQFFKYD